MRNYLAIVAAGSTRKLDFGLYELRFCLPYLPNHIRNESMAPVISLLAYLSLSHQLSRREDQSLRGVLLMTILAGAPIESTDREQNGDE